MKQIIKFVKDYPERIVLTVCILVAFVVFIKFLSASEEPIVAEVKNKAALLKKLINTKEPLLVSDIKYFNNVKVNWENVTPARETNNWLMYHQPVYEVEVKENPAVNSAIMNLPPVFESITATAPDTVKLIWLKNDKTTANIKSYRIYRKAKCENDFSMVKEVFTDVISPTELSIIEYDKTVSATMEYSYYITAYTDEKTVKNQQSEPSQQMKIVTPDDITLEFDWSNGTIVIVKIGKYVNGVKEFKNSSHSKGDIIGIGEFKTTYEIESIEQTTIEKSMAGGTLLIKKYKIKYKNIKNGEKLYGITTKNAD
ncbi:MAG: hypothetical protein V1701_08860 [Planctomycetota bacterium]